MPRLSSAQVGTAACAASRSHLQHTSVFPGFRMASCTATVESSQAATAMVPGATAGDDTPYLQLHQLSPTPLSCQSLPLILSLTLCHATLGQQCKFEFRGASAHRPRLVGPMPPSLPADTTTTSPAAARLSSAALSVASGPCVGHVGPEPRDLRPKGVMDDTQGRWSGSIINKDELKAHGGSWMRCGGQLVCRVCLLVNASDHLVPCTVVGARCHCGQWTSMLGGRLDTPEPQSMHTARPK